MNFQFYLEKLYASEDFQKFIEENKDAYLCSCFFVIDSEKGDNKQHFDYFLPVDKKMFSFKIESGCERVPVENFESKVLTKISDNYNFSFNKVEKLILERMEKENIKSKIQKILLSLQNVKETPQAYPDKSSTTLKSVLREKKDFSTNGKISTRGKDVLLGTVFISALGMIKVSIDLDEMKITEFEKKSFLDMLRVVKRKD
ncbi:MAG: hypothetical protein ABFQ65_04055 [Nanoarchaeota archaeon]